MSGDEAHAPVHGDAALAAVLGAQGGVVVLAPHPDDETLGCGALLAACFASGRPAHVIVVTDGARSHPGSGEWPPARLARRRRGETREAVRRLGGGAVDVSFLDLPDGGAPDTGPIAEAAADRVHAICTALGARTLVATGPEDAHADHRAAAAIAALAAAAAPGLRVLHYPIWPPGPDDPVEEGSRRVRRLPLGPHAEIKRHALAAHASQHGTLVTDDPDGFVLPPAFVATFLCRDEIFLETADALRDA